MSKMFPVRLGLYCIKGLYYPKKVQRSFSTTSRSNHHWVNDITENYALTSSIRVVIPIPSDLILKVLAGMKHAKHVLPGNHDPHDHHNLQNHNYHTHHLSTQATSWQWSSSPASRLATPSSSFSPMNWALYFLGKRLRNLEASVPPCQVPVI